MLVALAETHLLEGDIESEIGFTILQKLGMSTYFVISRVLQPLMVQPLQPRFDSNFNKFARLLNFTNDLVKCGIAILNILLTLCQTCLYWAKIAFMLCFCSRLDGST